MAGIRTREGDSHVAYVSLYRKYRPQSFVEVVGQDHVTRTVINALDEGRLHHAYLFTGPRGTGKTSTARILAKSVNCEQGPTSTPCNACPQCVAITNGSSVDVIELDMASHGGVDDARELRDRALFAPASARKKVYILDEVHMASTAAFNALLKLIEEPPDHVVFTMATTDPQKVLPTIMSRVQRLDLRRVPAPAVADHVRDIVAREGGTIDDVALDAVVRAGDGSVRDTLSVLEQVLAFSGGDITGEHVAQVLGHTPFERTAAAVDAMAQGNLVDAIGVVQQLTDDGHDLRRFALDLLQHLRDLLVLQVAPDRLDLVDATTERRAQLAAQSATVDRSLLLQAVEVVGDALVEMRQGPPRLPLELALAKVTTTTTATPQAAPAATQPTAPPAPPAATPSATQEAPPPPAQGTPAEGDGAGTAASTDDVGATTEVAPSEVAASADPAAQTADTRPAAQTADTKPAELAAEPVSTDAPDHPTAADTEADTDIADDDAPVGADVPAPTGLADDLVSRANARAARTASEGGPPTPPQDRPAGPEADYPAPPEPDATADLDRIEAAWPAVLELVRAASPRFHAIYEPARPVRLRNGILTLAYAERYRSFHAEQAKRGDHEQALAAAVQQTCGVRIRVDTAVDGDGPARPRPQPLPPEAAAPSPGTHAPPPGPAAAAASPDDEEVAVREAEDQVGRVAPEDAVEQASALIVDHLGATEVAPDDA
jgi:DNA polymerase III subunit gamma/tau